MFRMGRLWSQEDDELLRQLYPHTPNRDLMVLFTRSEGSIQVRAQSLGLRKQRIKKRYKRCGDKRRTHAHQGVLNRIIENQRRAGFLKEEG